MVKPEAILAAIHEAATRTILLKAAGDHQSSGVSESGDQEIRRSGDYQISREGQPLEQGFAFELVKKLLGLNDSLKDKPVEVILLSRNSADTGLRVFNSIQHYGLDISRAASVVGGRHDWA